jgi:hypothetical protein
MIAVEARGHKDEGKLCEFRGLHGKAADLQPPCRAPDDFPEKQGRKEQNVDGDVNVESCTVKESVIYE